MGKKSHKTETKTTPWQPAQGDILGAIGTVRDTVGNNQPTLDNLAGGVRQQLPGLYNQAFAPSPLLGAGGDYATDVLGGKYLQDNPYLSGMISQTANDVTDRVNSMFGRSGAALGTQHAGVMTRELANAENQMRYGNYAQERQNQQGAASLLPALFGSQFAGVAPALAATQTAGQLPFTGIGALSPIIGLGGGSGQTSGTQPGGWGNDLLNAAASIGSAAIMASDRRLKTKIKLLRRDPDGLGWYEFAYKSTPDEMRIGVMADEVKELRPNAYVKGFVNGEYDGVNYAELRRAA